MKLDLNFDLKKLFAKKKSKSVIGIDIGSSSIKIVQLSEKKGKAVLDTYGSLSLASYANVEIGKATNLSVGKLVVALTDILKEAKVTTNIGAVAISFNASLMTTIELPVESEKHLKEIIPNEAKKYVPVPIGEVSLDWSVIASDEVKEFEEKNKKQKKSEEDKYESPAAKRLKEKHIVSKLKVLIVAIQNDVINRFKDIVNSASLDAEFFEIEIFSALRSVLEPNSPPVMIMDIGAASTKTYIVEKGNVESSHIINKGSQDITGDIARSLGVSVKEAEILKRMKGLSSTNDKKLREAIFLTLDQIFVDIGRILRNYQNDKKKSLEKIILVGGGASMKGLPEAASANLQIKVETGDPFSKVDAPAFVYEILKNNGPEFAVAVGVALRRLGEEDE